MAGTLTDVVLSKEFFYVGDEAQFLLTMTLMNDIPANGIIFVYFPTYATFYPDTQNPFCLDFDNNYAPLICDTHTYANSLQGVFAIEIINKCETTCLAGSTINILITKLKNPGSIKPITNSFGVATFTSSNELIDTVNITDADGLELYPSSFNYLSLMLPVSPILTGSVTPYKLKINSLNGIPYSTGRLQITFPSQIEFSSSASTCTATSDGSSLTCVLDKTNSMVKITNNNANKLFNNEDIIISIGSVIQNPKST